MGVCTCIKGIMQESYLRSMGSMNSVPTPLSTSFVAESYIDLQASAAIPIKQYQTILGDILWLIFTRYDVQHAMSVLSQKTHYCTQRDYEEAIHVLRYIFGNPDKSLIFHAAPAHQRPTSLRGVLDMPIFIMDSSDSAR